jgi:hypothetical protein
MFPAEALRTGGKDVEFLDDLAELEENSCVRPVAKLHGNLESKQVICDRIAASLLDDAATALGQECAICRWRDSQSFLDTDTRLVNSC